MAGPQRQKTVEELIKEKMKETASDPLKARDQILKKETTTPKTTPKTTRKPKSQKRTQAPKYTGGGLNSITSEVNKFMGLSKREPYKDITSDNYKEKLPSFMEQSKYSMYQNKKYGTNTDLPNEAYKWNLTSPDGKEHGVVSWDAMKSLQDNTLNSYKARDKKEDEAIKSFISYKGYDLGEGIGKVTYNDYMKLLKGELEGKFDSPDVVNKLKSDAVYPFQIDNGTDNPEDNPYFGKISYSASKYFEKNGTFDGYEVKNNEEWNAIENYNKWRRKLQQEAVKKGESKYSVMTKKELDNELVKLGKDYGEGKISDEDYYATKDTINMWRIQSADADELDKLIEEIEEGREVYDFEADSYDYYNSMEAGQYEDVVSIPNLINMFKKPEGFELPKDNGEFERWKKSKERVEQIESQVAAAKARKKEIKEYKEAQEKADAVTQKYKSLLEANGIPLMTTKITTLDADMSMDFFAQLTNEEKAVYQSLNRASPTDANTYAKELKDILEKRAAQAKQTEAIAFAKEHPYLAGIKGIALNIAGGGVAAVDNLGDLITEGKVNTYDASARIVRESQALRQGGSQYMQQKYGKGASWAYNTGLSLVENAIVIAATKGIGKAAGLGVKGISRLSGGAMALNAASNEMITIADRGGNDAQIIIGGIAAGTAEWFFEKYSIENLITPGSGNKFLSMLKQSGIEASEETLTEVANILSDAAIMGQKSESNVRARELVMNGLSAKDAMKQVFMENLDQVLQAGMSGFASGAVMGGGQSVINGIGESRLKNTIAAEIGKNATLPNVVRIMGQIEGRNPDYYTSKEAIDTANAVLKMTNGTATKADYELIRKSEGARTVVLSAEGTKAWESLKAEADRRVQSAEKIPSPPEAALSPLDKGRSGMRSENPSETEGASPFPTAQGEGLDMRSEGKSATISDGEIYSNGERVTIDKSKKVAGYVVLNEESYNFRKANKEGYDVIRRMAKDHKQKVQYVDGLTDSEGKALDGVITSEGIFINTQSKNPTRWAATHEFSHRMKQTGGKMWQRYQDYVISHLKETGKYEERYNLKKGAYAENEIDEEIASDYIGEIFADVKELSNFIRRNRRDAFGIRNAYYKVLDKLGLLDEKKKAQAMWAKAYREAMKNSDVEYEGKDKLYAGTRSKTADLESLQAAKKMKAEGKTDKEIWEKTGWGKGLDGKWKYEIDDSKAEFKRGGIFSNPDINRFKDLEYKFIEGTLTKEEMEEVQLLSEALKGVRKTPKYLSEIINHKELFEAYPELADVEVEFEKLDGSRGYYSRETKTITIENALPNMTAAEVLIHEIQHAIQHIEGFSRGNNIENAKYQKAVALESRKVLNWIISMKYTQEENPNASVAELNKITMEEYAEWPELIPPVEIRRNAIERFGSENAIAELRKTVKSFGLDKSIEGMDERDIYRNTAGEIEARDAAERKGLSAEERKKQFPESMIPRDNVVFADADVSFDIVTLDNGKTYIEASRQVVTGTTISDWRSSITKFFNQMLKNGDIKIKATDGSNLVITKDTAKKARDNYKIQNGNAVKMSNNEYVVKLHAEAHIDELSEVAKKINHSADKKNHPFAKDGFDYKIVYFKDFDGSYYEITLSVGINNGIGTVYNVGKIKTDNLPTGKIVSRKLSQSSLADLSVETSVSQNSPSVKGKKSVAGTRMEESSSSEVSESLKEENARLRAELENLHLQLEQAEGKGLDTKAIKKAAEDIKRAYFSKIKTSELHKDLTKLYSDMANNKLGGDEIGKRIREIADKVIAGATETIEYSEYGDLLNTIRTTKIAVPEDDKASFADGFSQFKKSNRGKLNLNDDGYPLYALWDDLCADYPQLFSEDTRGSEERLNRLLEVRDEFSPYEKAVFGSTESVQKARYALENDIMESFFKIPEGGDGKYVFYDTRASQAQKELQQAKEKYEKLLERTVKKLEGKIEKTELAYENEINRIEERHERELDKKNKELEKKEEKYEKLLERTVKKLEGKIEKTELAYENEINRIEERHERELDKKNKELEKKEEKNEKLRDRYDREKVKKGIDRYFNYLFRMYSDPTDARHIPEALRRDVGNILDRINFETKYTDKLKEKGEESALSIRLDGIAEVFRRIQSEAWGVISTDDSPTIDSALRQELEELISEIPVDESGNSKRLEDMTTEELKAVYEMLIAVHHAVTKSNEAFSDSIKGNINENAEKVDREMENVRSKKKGSGEKIEGEGGKIRSAYNALDKFVTADLYKPWDFFHKIGGTMEKLYIATRTSFDDYLKNLQTFKKKLDEATEKINVKKLDKVETIKLLGGAEIKLTRGQMIGIVATYKRPAGRTHILEGGVVTNKPWKDENGHKKTGVAPIKLNEHDVGVITEMLTSKETDMMFALVDFMSKECSKWGNETSVKLLGYEKYGEGWYYPIKVWDGSLDKSAAKKGEKNLTNKSFTKKLAPNAGNAIVINDFLDVVMDHVNSMNMYSTVALPLLDMERILNHRGEGTASKDVRQAIRITYGQSGEEFIYKWIRSVNGTAQKVERDFFDKLIANTKKAQIAFKLSVFLKQGTSIVRVLQVMNPVHLRSALKSYVQPRKTIREMQENVPIAFWKSLGFRDPAMGTGIKNALLGTESVTDKLGFGLYGLADDFTWGMIYNAVKTEVKSKNKGIDVNSEEFKQKVVERFNYIIDRTQVVDSPFHSAQIMKSNNPLTKLTTSYMSEPLTTLNLYRTDLQDTISEAREKRTPIPVVTKSIRSTSTFLLSSLLLAIAGALPKMLKEDPEDKYTKDGKEISKWERFQSYVKEGFADEANIFNLVPYLNRVIDIWEGWEQKDWSFEAIEDVVNSIKNIITEEGQKKSWYAKIKDFSSAAAVLFGVPYGNAVKEIEGIAKTIMHEAAGEYGDYLITKSKWNIKDPKNKSKFMKYYENAIINGHSEEAAEIFSDYYGIDNNEGMKAWMEESSRLYKATGDDKHFYNPPEDKFKFNGKDIELDEKKYKDYEKGITEKFLGLIDDLIKSDYYKKLSDKEKANELSKLRTWVTDKEKMKYYPVDLDDNKHTDEVLAAMDKLYLETGKSALGDLYNSTFSVDGKEIQLEGNEYHSFLDKSYDVLWNMAYDMVQSEEYKNLNSEEKLSAFSDLKTYAKETQYFEYGDHEMEGWKGKVYSGEEAFIDNKVDRLNEGYFEDNSKAWRENNFNIDESKYSEAEIKNIEDFEKSASKFYVAHEMGIPYDEGDYRAVQTYHDYLKNVMSLEEFAGIRAYAKKTAATMGEGSTENLSTKELRAYLDSTEYDRATKGALFEAIGNKNWKNPYVGGKVGDGTRFPVITHSPVEGEKSDVKAPLSEEKVENLSPQTTLPGGYTGGGGVKSAGKKINRTTITPVNQTKNDVTVNYNPSKYNARETETIKKVQDDARSYYNSPRLSSYNNNPLRHMYVFETKLASRISLDDYADIRARAMNFKDNFTIEGLEEFINGLSYDEATKSALFEAIGEEEWENPFEEESAE